eukprot:TRINITY_DN81760_c0_g1_i1.p1 TRINITY_DN81760_c0_g1~~TRINITY_DN81760_c0_g1_i1.p1  ORF type:complete len:613 (+),score=145.00 TRINITY_DN81760_c0_g1_i1:105-1943(+)
MAPLEQELLSGIAPPNVEEFTRREIVAVGDLLAARKGMLTDERGVVDTRTAKGYEACSEFLLAVDSAAQGLEVEPASRAYRSDFMESYRSLFQGEDRSYRMDIFEVGTSLSRSRSPAVFANGEEHELGWDAVTLSTTLSEALGGLCTILDAWAGGCSESFEDDAEEAPRWLERVRTSSTSSSSSSPAHAFSTDDLRAALAVFDHAWARFEHVFVNELTKIQARSQEHALAILQQATDCERALREFERQHSRETLSYLPAYQVERMALVACIGRLNVAANFSGRGRGDLSLSILEMAVELLETLDDDGHPVNSMTRAVAEQVVDSFQDMRKYLAKVRGQLDKVEPNLCRNRGLVARLCQWEETWEKFARYIMDEAVYNAMSNILPELQRLWHLVPEFRGMCEDCDAELFLTIPRIVCIAFFLEPSGVQELMSRLLPHRFDKVPVSADRYDVRNPSSRSSSSSSSGPPSIRRTNSLPNLIDAMSVGLAGHTPCMGLALHRMARKFWKTEGLLRERQCGSLLAEGDAGVRDVLLRDVLLRCAVQGPGGCAEILRELEAPEDVVAILESLMNELEGWSMELARHHAEDWNECMSMLMLGLCGDTREPQQSGQAFVV